MRAVSGGEGAVVGSTYGGCAGAPHWVDGMRRSTRDVGAFVLGGGLWVEWANQPERRWRVCRPLSVAIASRISTTPTATTAVIAAIGNGAAFRKGREFAAWLGVVPREHSTGGKQKLLGIGKRGNSYLRRLFVQGARAVLQHRAKQSSGLSAWLAQLTSRTHRNVAALALANKLARMAWAVLAKNEAYRCPVLVSPTGLQMTPG